MGAFDSYLKAQGKSGATKSSGSAFNSFAKKNIGIDLSGYDKYEKALREEDEREKKLQQIIDQGLDQGMSWEEISKQTKIPLDQVKSYSQQARPEYGITPPDTRGFASKAFDQVNIFDSGRDWGRAEPSAEGAEKSTFDQLKDTGSSLFSGVEKVGDAVNALTGRAEEKMNTREKIFSDYIKEIDAKIAADPKNEELKKGRQRVIKKHMEMREEFLKDTEWAGTEDKGTLDRLKTSAGVALEATSEIVPFMKAGKAVQLTKKGGTAFGAATTVAHGTGQELNNPEGFDWKNVALQTAVGTVGGRFFGGVAQNTANAKLLMRNVTTRQLLDAADNVIEPITDVSRLLSATTHSTRTAITSRLDEINSQLSDIRTGKAASTTYSSKLPNKNDLGTEKTLSADVKLTKAGTPDRRYKSIEKLKTAGTFDVPTPNQTGVNTTTGKQLRALVKERDELLKQLDLVESGSGPLEQVAKINDELTTGQANGTLTPEQAADKISERQTILASVKDNPSETAKVNAAYIEEQANTAIKNQALVDPSVPSPGQGTPLTAQRAAKMGKTTTDATYDQVSKEAQTATYNTLKENNPEIIEAIVKGDVDATQFGLTNAHVLTSEANAAKNGAGLKEIVNAGGWSRISKGAQEVQSAGNLDADSPLRVLRNVVKARQLAKKEGVNIIGDISEHEADQILVRYNGMVRLREKYLAELADGKLSLNSKLAYGQAKVDYDKYAHDLMPGKTIKEWVKNPFGIIKDIAGTSKSLRATADVSAILRQGLKLLATGHYRIWARNTLKSLRVAVKSFGDESVMDAVNANIVSRENYLNGLYKKMGIPVYDVIEEAFPNQSLKKVPFLRKLYGASDAAYTSFMQLNRADLADMHIRKALKANIDLSVEGYKIGNYVNSLSSRGSLGRAEGKIANAVNNVFFSPRLMKSNFDVLGGHIVSGGGGAKNIGTKAYWNSPGSNYVRKHAALNLIKIAATTYGILKLADEVRPNSVEWDPRSSNYGKVKIGNTRFDVTGGMSSLVTLGSRLATGKTKSATTDIITNLDDPEVFKGPSTWGTITQFGENKLSPFAAVLQDFIAKEDFNGKKPTLGSSLKNLGVPIIVDNYEELSKDPNAAPIVASMILEGLGVSTNTYDAKDDWSVKSTKAQKGFQKAVGPTKFKVANDLYNQRFTDWFREIRYGDEYGKMTSDQRRKLLEDEANALQKQIMGEFGYTYKITKAKADPNKGLIDGLRRYSK